MKVKFFANQNEFRTWLMANHKSETELLVGFYKVGTNKPSLTWSQSVDQALCFGWIDGVRRSIDSESYCIRFTPRRPGSIWSAINIKKMEILIDSGLMTPEGLTAFGRKTVHKTNIYSHENKLASLSIDYEKKFKENRAAWEFFEKQAPSYCKVMLHWIMSAKQEKTQLARLEKAIKVSAEKKRML